MKKFLSIVLALTILVSIAIPVTAGAVAKVTGLKQTGSSTTSVDISWDRFSGATKYKVEYSDTKNGTYKEDTSYNTDGSEGIYSLFRGSTYYVKVTPYVNGWVNASASEPFEVVTSPDGLSDLKQTKAAKSSMTLSWTAVSGATSYNIYKDYGNNNVKKVGTSKTTSYTVTGLSNKKALDFNYIRVAPVRNSATYGAEGYDKSIYNYYLRLTPKKGETPKFSYYWSYSDSVSFTTPSLKFQDGYQFQIFKANKKKALKTLNKTTSVELKKGQFYKVRTRSYALVNSKKNYGAWSSYKYFTLSLKNIRTTSKTQRSVKLAWSKPKGGKVKYDIYVSKEYNKGLKKTVKNLKRNSVKVTKIGKKSLKKNTYYYFYIVPKVKSGKKYKASPIMTYLSTYTKY